MPPKKIPLLVKKGKSKPKTKPGSKIIKKKTVASVVIKPKAAPAAEPVTITVEPKPEPVAKPTVTVKPKSAAEPESKTKSGADKIYVEDGLRIDIDDEPDPDEDEYMELAAEQKEELIYKLETRKHVLKKKYKKATLTGEDTRATKDQLKEVCRLLAVVKKCDAVDKIKTLEGDAANLKEEFKRKFRKLAVSDFKKIIDLTAPKEERKPDITTEQIWKRSKNVIFKNKTYRKATDEKVDKFNNKMKLKSVPKHIRKKMKARTEDTVKNIHIHRNHSDLLNYKQYDPVKYNGLNIY